MSTVNEKPGATIKHSHFGTKLNYLDEHVAISYQVPLSLDFKVIICQEKSD